MAKILNKVNKETEIKLLTQSENLGTKKYNHIKTENVISFFEKNGWQKIATSSKFGKNGGNKQFHVVIMENLKFNNLMGNPRIIIGNSYDCSKSLELRLGFFRTICANGLVAGETLYKFNKKHVGNFILEKLLINEYSKIVAKLNELNSQIQKMSNKILTPKQKFKKAYGIIRQSGYKLNNKVIDFSHVLKAERKADKGNDAFKVMNVIQEKIMRIGIKTIEGSKLQKIRSNKKRYEVNQIIWEKFAA